MLQHMETLSALQLLSKNKTKNPLQNEGRHKPKLTYISWNQNAGCTSLAYIKCSLLQEQPVTTSELKAVTPHQAWAHSRKTLTFFHRCFHGLYFTVLLLSVRVDDSQRLQTEH